MTEIKEKRAGFGGNPEGVPGDKYGVESPREKGFSGILH
jgi:hypothetical protein